MDKKKRIVITGLILITICFTACGQRQKENPYGNIVAKLGDDDAYAFLVMDYRQNVMVTSNMLSESQASAYCDVYYYIDDETKKLGTIMSEGMAYPVAFSKDGIFTASEHSVEKYVISEKEGALCLDKGVYEKYNDAGDEYYTVIINGKEIESTKNEYEEMLDEYAACQIVHFSYGASGCLNEILEP